MRTENTKWPTSAIVAVSVLATVLVFVLLMEWADSPIIHMGRYDPNAAGSAAEWLAGLATIALPISLWINARQLRLQQEELRSSLLDREREHAEREQNRVERDEARAEREAQRLLEQLAVRDALRVEIVPVPVVDPGLERLMSVKASTVTSWRGEMRNRGWEYDPDGDCWVGFGRTLTTDELLDLEPTTLLPKPWMLSAVCRNQSTVNVRLDRLRVVTRSGEWEVPGAPRTLGPEQSSLIPVPRANGRTLRFKTAAHARQYAERAHARFDHAGEAVDVEGSVCERRTR